MCVLTEAHIVAASMKLHTVAAYKSKSLNSLKGRLYKGLYRVRSAKGDTGSLDYGSHNYQYYGPRLIV